MKYILLILSLGNLLYGENPLIIRAQSPITYTNGLIAIPQANTSTNGFLSSSDWNTFHSTSGAAITSITGDATATGPGSSSLTLSTVNSNIGSFGSVNSVGSFTVNGKGLITAATSNSIQISESQVTGLASSLALLAPLASPIFTGYITTPSGTISIPGIVIGSNGGGFYQLGSGSLGFSDGGTNWMQLGPSGIKFQGTTSVPLKIAAGISDSGYLGIWLDGSGNAFIQNSNNSSLNLGTNATTYLSVGSAGSVTIGNGSAATHGLNTTIATNGSTTVNITNAPAGVGTIPAGYIKININGTVSYIPYLQ